MEEKNRKGISLDEIKRREVCAILSVGCSRRVAARYVGCSPSTIMVTATREKEFRRDLDRAEQSAEIEYMQNIRQASKKSQYWRAAAWALERCHPEEYAARGANTVTVEQVRRLFTQFVEIVIEEIPVAVYRKNLLHRLETLTAEYGTDKYN